MGETLYSTCRILNRVPYNFFLKKPLMSYREKRTKSETLGCLEKINIPINKKRKIVPKTIDCVFVGYYLHNTTYRFLVVNLEGSHISNDTIMESRNVTFFENVFSLKNKLSKFVCDISCSNLSSYSNVNKDIVF